MTTQTIASAATTDTPAEVSRPIIIDLGKQKRKRVKDLKAGTGTLWTEVHTVLDEVKTTLGQDADGKVLVPVVMIYKEREPRTRLRRLLPPIAK